MPQPVTALAQAPAIENPSAFADGVWLVVEEPILPEGVVIGISHDDVVDDFDL